MNASLVARCNEIGAELQAWEALTADGEPLVKHRSQVAALSRMFGRAGTALAEQVRIGQAPLADLLQNEADLWRIWSVFQVPLLQRRHPRYGDRLSLADGFAWSCYRPAAARIADPVQQARVLEPPLVFCEPTEVPTALVRGSSLAREVAGGDEAVLERLRRPDSATMLRLPVPLVSIPWGCLGFLPDLLLVAHEVGHLADGDFGITPAVRQALPGLLGPNSYWLPRIRELIADIYGTLAAGLPFLQTLARFLEPWAQDEADGAPPAAAYPPVAIRLLAASRVLLLQGLPQSDLPPLPPVEHALAAETGTIVDAVCRTPLPQLSGVSLLQAFGEPVATPGGYGDVFTPSKRRTERAADFNRLRVGQAPLSKDIVVLLGALAEAAFAPGGLPDAAKAAQNVVQQSLAIRPKTPLAVQQKRAELFLNAEFDLLQAIRASPDDGPVRRGQV